MFINANIKSKGGDVQMDWSISPDAMQRNPVMWILKVIGYVIFGFAICAVAAYIQTRNKK